MAAVWSCAATRPHYGGTLRIATAEAFTSLDPAESGQADTVARHNILRLLFETLVALDDHGVSQPLLADSWASSAGGQRWQFILRQGITFSDGSVLTADAVATSLRKANPTWKISSQGLSINIELESPALDFPVELSLLRNAIVQRNGKLVGTGPFVLSQWEPGRKLVLTARDDYSGGRVYLDSIELVLNKSLREQNIAFDLGRVDAIEIAPELARRPETGGRRLVNSSPTELVVLWFAHDAQSPTEQKLRGALSLSIDRTLMRALLQNEGEPAGSLLPTWMTGYGFVFSSDSDQVRAKRLRTDVGQSQPWTLGYDDGDSLARLLAERVVLNARDAGLSIQTTSASSSDIRLTRIPLVLSDGRIELEEMSAALAMSSSKLASSSPENLYTAEKTLLESRRVIPLLHLRYVFATNETVQDWSVGRDGSWDLPNVWLSGKQ